MISFSLSAATLTRIPRSAPLPTTTPCQARPVAFPPVLAKVATMDSEKKNPPNPRPPEPPEKPLPGDCCGSGCVRCVWDIYYDELEDYEKLVASSNHDNKDNNNTPEKTDSNKSP